jgi:hypothetical protein
MSSVKSARHECVCHLAFAIRREIARRARQSVPGIDPRASSILDAPKTDNRRLPFSISALARRQI